MRQQMSLISSNAVDTVLISTKTELWARHPSHLDVHTICVLLN